MLMIQQFYQQLIQNPNLLKIGDQLIYQKLSHQSNRQATIQLLLEYPEFRLVVLTQNIFVRLWNHIPTNQKQFIRRTLLQALHKHSQNNKYLQALAIFISKIHNIQGYQFWIPYYRVLLQQTHMINIVVQYFLIVIRDADNQINTIAQFLLIFSLKVLVQSINKDLKLSEKMLILTYNVIRSFSCLSQSDSLIVNRCFNGTFQKWISVLKQILTNGPQALHKYSLKILTVLYSDLPKIMLDQTPKLIFTILMYFNQIIPIYINQNSGTVGNKFQYKSQQQIYINDINFEENTWSQGIVYQSLQLIQSILIHKKSKSYNIFGNYVLINNLYNILMISKLDQISWLNDPNKFIADCEDQSSITLRNRILSFISIIIQKDKDSVEILKLIIENGIQKQSQVKLKQTFQNVMKNKNIESKLNEKKMYGLTFSQLLQIFSTSFIQQKQDNWRRKQTAFLLLNTFSQDLLILGINKQKIIETLIYQIQNGQHPLVKIQALNTLIKWAEQIQNNNLYSQLLKYSLKLLNISYLGLKIMAVKGIGVFSRNIRLKKIQNYIIEQIHIAEIVSLINRLNEQTLHIFIDSCIQISKLSKFSNQLLQKYLVPYGIKLIQNFYHDGFLSSILLQLFLEIYSKQFQQNVLKRSLELIQSIQYKQLSNLYLKLIEGYLNNHVLLCNLMDLIIYIKMISKYNDSEDVITAYIRFGQIDQQLLLMLMAKLSKKWALVLHRRGFYIDLNNYLVEGARRIIEISSNSELQNELVLIIYAFYKNFNQTKNYLKSVNLYNEVIGKWVKYLGLFQGELLKKGSIIILSKMQQDYVKEQVNKFIKGNLSNLKKQNSQWLDEEDQNEDDELKDYTGYLGYSLVNSRVQKQLSDILPQLATHQLFL